MDTPPPPGIRIFATNEDVRMAIEMLSDIDKVRLMKAATIFLPGSEYACAMDLLNEVVLRTMNGEDGNGRRWPTDVPFMAYMIETMRSLVSDSRRSFDARKKLSYEFLATETMTPDEVLFQDYDIYAESAENQLEEVQDRQALEERQNADLTAIDEAFKDDSQIQWILMGYKDGYSATEIRELSEMSKTEYATAQRRLRRKIEKLFGNRSAL
ncbi:hypothetical protein [Herbaspirillum robiniae]|uniref:Sigma-70 family RNA polymerase sigma factor n=1 Tax=Herbaspirillum robiniae TaxID=2014887 RepID=A0ABX2M6W3_9BURK|nr:hypothetical protein [Herbaspirillum robiniae]NUU03991.1 hypothetical protein [Herbaspirillum robiniae]